MIQNDSNALVFEAILQIQSIRAKIYHFEMIVFYFVFQGLQIIYAASEKDELKEKIYLFSADFKLISYQLDFLQKHRLSIVFFNQLHPFFFNK